MMRQLLLLCFVVATLLSVECTLSVKSFLQHRTTTEQPTTTELPRLVLVYNRVPKIDPACTINYQCKKRLKEASAPKPCLKYCVHFVTCPNTDRKRGKSDECFELEEQSVHQEYVESQSASVVVQPVAMIDFPCQPGYLPDSRGRCREVW